MLATERERVVGPSGDDGGGGVWSWGLGFMREDDGGKWRDDGVGAGEGEARARGFQAGREGDVQALSLGLIVF